MKRLFAFQVGDGENAKTFRGRRQKNKSEKLDATAADQIENGGLVAFGARLIRGCWRTKRAKLSMPRNSQLTLQQSALLFNKGAHIAAFAIDWELQSQQQQRRGVEAMKDTHIVRNTRVHS